jgi:hypothetical protein
MSLIAMTVPSIASGQQPRDPAVVAAAQREAMSRLTFLDGVWRGTAWTLTPSGDRHEITQTERVGPFLEGAVKVIEGRGYEADGSVAFNAMAIISFNPATEAYRMRSYAGGQAGDFAFTPTADGFQWEIPAGPATIRYTAIIEDGLWQQVGDRLVEGREPIRFFEMTLRRVGDTEWPAAGAVGPG